VRFVQWVLTTSSSSKDKKTNNTRGVSAPLYFFNNLNYIK
jgi:hypothetical protein